MQENIYVDLTRQFNEGRLRCILSSGQAVVMHKLAIMSKDGDWIVREDDEALSHVLRVLGSRNASYRLGAPLDVRWLSGGWSAHFEFKANGYRARTDFVTRPPRLSSDDLAALWDEQEANVSTDLPVPTLDLRRLIELKKTDRDRDYAVIGDLARNLPVREQLLTSRSARDLEQLAGQYPEMAQQLAAQRPILKLIEDGREQLEAALDAERRQLMRVNENRLAGYSAAAKPWVANWSALERQMRDLPLSQAHTVVVAEAEKLLPFGPSQV